MALNVSENQGSERELVTPDIHHAVCGEVIDLGVQDTRYGKKHKGRFIFQVEETVQEGQYAGNRKEISLWFNMTLGSASKPSTLREALEGWRGRPFTEADLANGAFNLESVQGVPCRLHIIHNTGNDGKVWDNIKAVMPPAQDHVLELEDYTPHAERQERREASQASNGSSSSPPPPATQQQAATAASGKVPF